MTVVDTRIPRQNYVRTLRIVNGFAAILHFALFLWIVIDDADWKVPVVVSYVNWGKTNATEGCEVKGNCYVSLKSHTYSTQLSLAATVAIFHLLSCVWEAIPIVAFAQYYAQCVFLGTNPFRWGEYFISAASMIIPIAVILGQIDIFAIVAVMGLTSATMLFGFQQELVLAYDVILQLCAERGVLVMAREKQEFAQRLLTAFKFLSHFGGWFCFVISWGLLTFAFFVSLNFSEVSPPSSIYPIIVSVQVTMLLLFGCFGFVQVYQVSSGERSIKRSVAIEIAYISLSFASKALLGVLVYMGIRARDRELDLGTNL